MNRQFRLSSSVYVVKQNRLAPRGGDAQGRQVRGLSE